MTVEKLNNETGNLAVKEKRENVHTYSDLLQMQSLPLFAKIQMTNYRIRQWYDAFDGNVYVSRSGGKDSDALGYLVHELYPDVPQVFCNTGLELKSVREHGLEIADVVLRPKMSFLEVLTHYGYPVVSKEVSQAVYECQRAKANGKDAPSYRMDKFNGLKLDKNGKKSSYNMDKYKFLLDAPFRISHLCCNKIKKMPAKEYEKATGQKPYIGTMASESRLRSQKWMKFGCNAYEAERQTSQPLSFWTEQDILQFIKEYNVPIAKAYGDIVYVDENGLQYESVLLSNDKTSLTTTGAKRTGCAFCLFGVGKGLDEDRFLRLKEMEPATYDYIMRGGRFDDEGFWIPDKGLGYKYVIDWLNEHGNLGIKY